MKEQPAPQTEQRASMDTILDDEISKRTRRAKMFYGAAAVSGVLLAISRHVDIPLGDARDVVSTIGMATMLGNGGLALWQELVIDKIETFRSGF